jgi:hypothetical protein
VQNGTDPQHWQKFFSVEANHLLVHIFILSLLSLNIGVVVKGDSLQGKKRKGDDDDSEEEEEVSSDVIHFSFSFSSLFEIYFHHQCCRSALKPMQIRIQEFKAIWIQLQSFDF